MRQVLLVFIFIFLSTFKMIACSCTFAWNDSFSKTVKTSELVALVKILSFDEYLERDILGHEGKMPYVMTVEIIKKYRGDEQREKIKIVGDNGILCRPYLSEFEINGYYLISPIPLDKTAKTKYEFFFCRTDYLKVDMDSNSAFGKYSMITKHIDLETFEYAMMRGDRDLLIGGSIIVALSLALVILRRNKKRNANKMYSA